MCSCGTVSDQPCVLMKRQISMEVEVVIPDGTKKLTPFLYVCNREKFLTNTIGSLHVSFMTSRINQSIVVYFQHMFLRRYTVKMGRRRSDNPCKRTLQRDKKKSTVLFIILLLLICTIL